MQGNRFERNNLNNVSHNETSEIKDFRLKSEMYNHNSELLQKRELEENNNFIWFVIGGIFFIIVIFIILLVVLSK